MPSQTPSPLNKTMTPFEWMLLITLSVLWGGSFFFASVAVQELPPFTIVMLRVGIGAVILHGVLRLSNIPFPVDMPVLKAFFVMGLINNAIPFCLLVWGQTHIAGGLAAILNATTPIFTVIVAHVLTEDEKITPQRLAGIIAGLVGVGVMIGVEFTHALDVNILAQLACIAAPVSYAFAVVYGRRFRQLGVKPMVTATGQVTTSTLILLPLVLMVDKPWLLAVPGLDTVASIVGLAALSTALAYIIYFRLLSTAGATNLALVTLLVPVSAVILGSAILGEVLAFRHFLGMAIIATGLLAIDGRVFEALKERFRS